MGLPIPLTIRASFLLSGMLGLHLEGITDSNGKPQVIETSVPFNLNSSQTMLTTTIEMGSNASNNSKGSNTTWNDSCCPDFKGQSRGVESASKSMKPHPRNFAFAKCGSSTCLGNEVCVTWEKQEGRSSSTKRTHRQSPQSYAECFPDDGLHYSKVIPSSGASSLCPPGEAHTIVPEPKACLRDNPPCNLVWKYTCGPESESPHSCLLKKCGPGQACYEGLSCGTDTPCVTTVECHATSDILTYN